MEEEYIPISPNKRCKHLIIDQKVKIVEYNARNLSFNKISELMEISTPAISRVIKRWERYNTVESPKGQGRKRKTSARDDRAIIRYVENNRFTTAKKIKMDIDLPKVCLNTIRNRIKEDNHFNSYWAARKPFISKINQTKRLNWAKEHLNWTIEQWKQVLWTDESPYCFSSKAKKKVWRGHNERYIVKCLQGTVKHDHMINVWGGFCFSGVGEIVQIHGIMDQYLYLQILQNDMQLSADVLFNRKNWIFQQDNDPKHTANTVKEYLKNQNIELLEWPAQSPDLNPIENLWSIIERDISDRVVSTEGELFKLIENAWKNIPVKVLNRLVESMSSRCKAVIESKGMPTKY